MGIPSTRHKRTAPGQFFSGNMGQTNSGRGLLNHTLGAAARRPMYSFHCTLQISVQIRSVNLD